MSNTPLSVTTVDLHEASRCPRRWLGTSHSTNVESQPTRELIKKIFLVQGMGRETRWTVEGIAKAWDSIFWKDKEVTQQNMDDSVRGILSFRRLYRQLPQEKFEVESTDSLSMLCDGPVILRSAGDFVLIFENRVETWVYGDYKVSDMRRSPLSALEHFLIQSKMRRAYAAANIPFFTTFYYSTQTRLNPSIFRIMDAGSLDSNTRLGLHLVDLVGKRIDLPIPGPLCESCKVQC